MSMAMHHCLSLLTSCKSLRALTQIHGFFIKSGVDSDSYLTGKLILQSAISVPEALPYARRLLFCFPEPDAFMFNTLVRGYCESDDPGNSVAVFVEMISKGLVFPDSFSLAFVVKAVANLRSLRTGFQMHCQALKHGLDSHLFVGTTLIGMYGECGCVEFARKVFDEMRQPNLVAWNAVITACFRGNDVSKAREIFDKMLVKNHTSWNVMLAGYTKAGEVESAQRIFSEMPHRDDVSWSTMIVGFAHNGSFSDAFSYFRELQRAEMRPNEVSLTGVLSACSQSGAFEFGKTIHGFVEKSGFSWIVSVNNALIDMYSRCGDVLMAWLVFEGMQDKTSIVSWTSMIAGLAMYGHGEEAIRLFNEMIASGVTPDGVSFVSLLYACSHAGLIKEGEDYFSKMKRVYHIEPAIEHYGCMVDLYGRSGKLQKAYNFISQMPIAPTAIVWRTLLGACSSHGNIEMAEQVKQRLNELDPNNSGDLVLLSNAYAIAGKWKDVACIRKSMIVQRIKKITAWSSVEVGKTMFKFTAGEKKKGIDIEAHEKLKEIILRLRNEAGYAPEVASALYDVEEEEKEDQVSKHSEKLALAFALARLPKGANIRIVKNLRICRDCHAVMKLTSKVYEVEIVVRDRNRFHSFKDGYCSCSDYW
ncbi:PREDICTED: pentatricopeptide repeat-containing protein At1g74630-like [Camelina sativa]|uniref:Pentatricopeptide repeat-containing protein At1g74630-like n=1 Tax=Camelina sativa TaxID=90675 RepID=A0ABM0WIH8_CAMSA|nr:PREDICTED: pentatricopeptide repeat-containing protein At1g74630-like [Camelina sativa]